MKTAIKLTSVVLAIAFCASAVAGPNEPVADQRRPVVKLVKQKPRRVCYVMTTSSAIPLPCDRIRGIPTTSSPMDIIGNKSPN